MYKKLLLLVCSIGLFVLTYGLSTTGSAAAPSEEPLLSQPDLQYVGAFRVPAGNFGGSSFDYGGTGLTYNPANNSLFIVGHPYQQQVAEISIPAPGNGSLDSLPVASVLQPFADVTNGRMGQIGSGNAMIGGLLPYAGNLYASAYIYYDATASQMLSHFVSSPRLGAGGSGPYQVGTMGAGVVDGYFGQVPAEWQSALGGPALTGQCCVSIISRSSYGPAAFTFDPAQIGSVNPVPANPLVYYPQSNPLAAYDATSPYFNGATRMGGIVMPAGSRSVLFIGRHGPGAFCYGEGTSNRSLAGQSTGDGAIWCYDPADSSKGVHAYPYSAYVWAYDANDLAAVRSGAKAPWSVIPYAVWPIDLPNGNSGAKMIGGVGYDSARQLLYVSEINGGSTDACGWPLIHVFKLSLGGAAAPTPFPTPTPTPTPAPQPPPNQPPAPTTGELSVWRPSDGTWYVRSSTSASTYQWGLTGDVNMPGDFDGDGVRDLAVWRPSNGTWYIRTSSSSYSVGSAREYQWGLPGDIPIAGDFDGDHRTDLAVWRPSDGVWYIRTSSSGYSVSAAAMYQWGLPGDVPVKGDFDGDGRTDLAVYRPSEGNWYIRTSGSGYQPGRAWVIQWGLPGDIPVDGDYDGDGRAEPAVWRPSEGTWYLTSYGGNGVVPYATYQWGLPGDVPLVHDLDCDGADDLTVWRPSNGTWYVLTSKSGHAVPAHLEYQWGLSGDSPSR